MAKLKVKASMRIKRRYLLLDAKSKEQVESVTLDYIGILGWAKSAPFFLSSKNGRIILAVERKSLNDVRASFEISPENIKVIKVSGTIKGLCVHTRHMSYPSKTIYRMQNKCLLGLSHADLNEA